MSPSRRLAYEILRLVEGGGYASDLLRARSQGLDPRDVGLASELVLGTLRFQGQLDFLIGHFSGHQAGRLDPEVRIALRLGIYQLRYLDRVPRHAAVSQSVDLVKRAHKRSASGLTNAVLRKVHRRPIPWPDRATELSMPAWLLEKWGQQFGTEVAATIARAALHPPETYIRIPLGSAVPESVSLKETDVPGCYRVIKGDTSDFRVQDIGSQSVVRLLEAGPGQTFLDLCAAPGNKTLQALESGVFAVACDISSTRMRALDGSGAHQVILDGTQPLPFRRAFDRILVDAPCSGTGTLGRNPEIKWRVQRLDLTRHRARQVKLLKNALDQLARGGRLVYSTCSLEDEENGKVVKEVVAESRPEIHLDHTALRIPGIAPGDGFFAAVITSE